MASAMVEDNILSAEYDQLGSMSTDDIIRASRLLDNEVRILKEELQRTNLELESYKEKIKENQEKIKLNKQLPYLVGNIVEVVFFGDNVPKDRADKAMEAAKGCDGFLVLGSSLMTMSAFRLVRRSNVENFLILFHSFV